MGGKDSGPGRAAAAVFAFATWAILALHPDTAASELRDASFAGEPYKVRPVDRSRLDPELRPTRVGLVTGEVPGTVIIDTRARRLYLIEAAGTAWRVGIGVGTVGRGWTGTVTVGRKARWPTWYPTKEMKAAAPGMPASIPPGATNPLGARALYLYRNGTDTLFRIHGTSEPWTVGTEASSGCFRLLNEDVIALFDRVPVGAKVIVR